MENLGKGTELYLRDMLIPTFRAYNLRASINPTKHVSPRGRTLILGSAHRLPGGPACDFGNSRWVSRVVFFKGQHNYFAPLPKTFQGLPRAYRLNPIKPSLIQAPECFSWPSSCLSPLRFPTSLCILHECPASCLPLLYAHILPTIFWTCMLV